MSDWAELLAGPPLTIHLVGIGGVGMAGLARLLQQKGHHVTGTDLQHNTLTQWLEDFDIPVFHAHDPAHVTEQTNLVIRTTAAPLSHPECQRALSLDIPVIQRGVALPALLRGHELIAVTGTHGKTTTTAMIAHLFAEAGEPLGHFVGGESAALGGVARLSQRMVIEADESDGTLVHYHPDVLVITNIEFDHMEHFADEQEMLAVFKQAIKQSSTVVYCADDPHARALCEHLPQAVPYGGEFAFYPGAHDCRFVQDGIEHTLGVPGIHNARNALAAFAVATHFGITVQDLSTFTSVDRRYQLVGENADYTVISDYAHHPTEIAAVLEVAGELPRRRVVVIYQPHRYTRTKMLAAQFPQAFANADVLVLAPVYAASEAEISGGTSSDLAEHIPQALLADSLTHAWEITRGVLTPGDALLILGAGDVVELAEWARRDLIDPA